MQASFLVTATTGGGAFSPVDPKCKAQSKTCQVFRSFSLRAVNLLRKRISAACVCADHRSPNPVPMVHTSVIGWSATMYMMLPRRVTIGVRGPAISIARVWGIRIDTRLQAAIACHEEARSPISEGTRVGKSCRGQRDRQRLDIDCGPVWQPDALSPVWCSVSTFPTPGAGGRGYVSCARSRPGASQWWSPDH